MIGKRENKQSAVLPHGLPTLSKVKGVQGGKLSVFSQSEPDVSQTIGEHEAVETGTDLEGRETGDSGEVSVSGKSSEEGVSVSHATGEDEKSGSTAASSSGASGVLPDDGAVSESVQSVVQGAEGPVPERAVVGMGEEAGEKEVLGAVARSVSHATEEDGLLEKDEPPVAWESRSAEIPVVPFIGVTTEEILRIRSRPFAAEAASAMTAECLEDASPPPPPPSPPPVTRLASVPGGMPDRLSVSASGPEIASGEWGQSRFANGVPPQSRVPAAPGLSSENGMPAGPERGKPPVSAPPVSPGAAVPSALASTELALCDVDLSALEGDQDTVQISKALLIVILCVVMLSLSVILLALIFREGSSSDNVSRLQGKHAEETREIPSWPEAMDLSPASASSVFDLTEAAGDVPETPVLSGQVVKEHEVLYAGSEEAVRFDEEEAFLQRGEALVVRRRGDSSGIVQLGLQGDVLQADPSYTEVDSAKFAALSPGNAVVTVSVGGVSDTLRVTVE